MNAVVQMSKMKGLGQSTDSGVWKRRPGGVCFGGSIREVMDQAPCSSWEREGRVANGC